MGHGRKQGHGLGDGRRRGRTAVDAGKGERGGREHAHGEASYLWVAPTQRLAVGIERGRRPSVRRSLVQGAQAWKAFRHERALNEIDELEQPALAARLDCQTHSLGV